MRKIPKIVPLHHRQILTIRYDNIYRVQISAHSERENQAISGKYPSIIDIVNFINCIDCANCIDCTNFKKVDEQEGYIRKTNQMTKFVLLK